MSEIQVPPVENIPINNLKTDQQNPNLMTPKQHERLKISIQKYGFIVPIITNNDLLIADGEQRWIIAKDLQMPQVPVIRLPVKDVDRRLLRQVLNKLRGEHDFNRDAEEFMRIIEQDGKNDLQALLDLSDSQLEKYLQTLRETKEETYEIPEIDKIQTTIKRGDIIQLGNHRLMCGDATSKEDVEALMDGNKADLLLTDPPYGISLETDWTGMTGSRKIKKKIRTGLKGRKYPSVIGDNKPFDVSQFDFVDVDEQFWFGADYYHHTLPDGGSWIVWDKRLTENMDKVLGNPVELIWSKVKHRKEIIREIWAGVCGFQEDTETRIHPTQKPLKVLKWLITKYTHNPQTILDLFGGSGSTLIACEQTERVCYMMEIDPRYCQVITDRYISYVGSQAKVWKIINGKKIPILDNLRKDEPHGIKA